LRTQVLGITDMAMSTMTHALIAILVAWPPKRLDPFGIYRPQATFFAGRCDGKIAARRNQVSPPKKISTIILRELRSVDEVKTVAAEAGATPAQIARRRAP
jgi:hypothetical protein